MRLNKAQSTALDETQQLMLLEQALSDLREATQIEALAPIVLTYCRKATNYDLVWIGFHDRAQNILISQGGMSQGQPLSERQKSITVERNSVWEQLILAGEAIQIPDLGAEPRAGSWGKLAQKLQIQGAYLLPISHQQQCYGGVLLGSKHWGMLMPPHEQAPLNMLCGQIATSLQLITGQPQTQPLAGASEVLTSLLDVLSGAQSLTQSLDRGVRLLQRNLHVSQVSIYWFEPEQRYFWQRITTRTRASKVFNQPSASSEADPLYVRHCPGLYQKLCEAELLWLGPEQSPLQSRETTELLQALQAETLLLAPIVVQQRLFGFCSLEHGVLRVWTEAEQQLLRNVAQLLAIASPNEVIEHELCRGQTAQQIIATLAQAIRNEQDWHQALNNTAQQVSQHLQTEHFILLTYEPDQRTFPVVFQQQVKPHIGLNAPLDALSDVDWRLLTKAKQAIMIEDLEEDLRLLAWQPQLQALGVQSLMLCTTTIKPPLSGVLIAAHTSPHRWSTTDQTLLLELAQHVGVISHQWQLQQQVDQQTALYQSLQWGLTSIQHISDLQRLERVMTQSVAQLLHAPLAILLTWPPGHTTAQIAAQAIANAGFLINEDAGISLALDPLIQRTLATDEVLQLNETDLTAETRYWLSAPELGSLLVMTLRTAPEEEPLGIMLLGDQLDRVWSEQSCSLFGILATQLAWFRRSLLLTERLRSSQQRLEDLNWYKQFRLGELRQMVDTTLQRLLNLPKQPELQVLGHNRPFQQVGQQLQQISSNVLQLVRQERWQLQRYQTSMAVSSFLKRALERLKIVAQHNQLWLQVHAEEVQYQDLQTDIVKLEGIVYQVATAACLRSPQGNRVDFWCRLIDAQTLDFSITDAGTVEPRLLQELAQGRPVDPLTASTLDSQPGLGLAIAQRVLADLGGSLELSRLDDGRLLSRLVLPFLIS
ncbi:MAG: GAF domain-containing protein [Cyanobacteria bacterium P01_H01_bin.121]